MAQDVVFSQGECTIYKSVRRLDICCLASQAMMPSATTIIIYVVIYGIEYHISVHLPRLSLDNYDGSQD
jgi:hypothetical protein